MFKRTVSLATAAGAFALAACSGTAASANRLPSPQTFRGAKVSVFAVGLKNPTSFAFGDGAIFAGDSGSTMAPRDGGVYVLRNGMAREIPSSTIAVSGMQFHSGVLYMSAAARGATGPRFQILAWRRWNGTTFLQRRVIYTAPPGFQGFNGLAFGPDGRLYVAVDAGLLNDNDHGPSSLSPYLYDILSMKSTGAALRVYASGIRQPWQIAFAPGSSEPFVSDLGQDFPKTVKNPPDFLLRVKPGDDYGFPECNHVKGSPCGHFSQPFAIYRPHTNIMGLAAVGRTLYMGSYLGLTGRGGALFSMPVHGGRLRPVVTGFPIATDALAANGGYLYVGGSTQSSKGYVYRVRP